MAIVKREKLQDLTILESLVINTVRAIGYDLAALDRFEMDFIAQLGPKRGRCAFYALLRMGKLLQRFGRRSWQIKPMGCPDIAEAEKGLLTMIAAQQANNSDHAIAISHWFCRAEAHHDIASEAANIGIGFSNAGQEIPLRTIEAPARYGLPLLHMIVAHISGKCIISANSSCRKK